MNLITKVFNTIKRKPVLPLLLIISLIAAFVLFISWAGCRAESSCEVEEVKETQALETEETPEGEIKITEKPNNDNENTEIKEPSKTPAPHNPRLILYSFINPEFLRDTARFWGTETGFRGFMIPYVCDWTVSMERMEDMIPRLKEMNDECLKYGIDSNFIKVSMGHLKKLNWKDEEEWQKLMEHFRFTVKVAKEAGFAGIALDTEPYQWRTNAIWNYANELYTGSTREEMEDLLEKRGFEMMSIIKEGFPEAEFIIFPEGSFYYEYPDESTRDTRKIYNLWGSFFRGLCRADLENGIAVGTERTYHMTKPGSIEEKYKKIEETLKESSENPQYWDTKCSVALGAAPLGKSFEDKGPRYPYREFKSQLKEFAGLSPRYVWIYGHGAAWWKMDDPGKYKNRGFALWRPYYQEKKPVRNINDYYKLTREIFCPGSK